MAENILWYTPLAKITVRELALFSVLGALTFAAKYVMSFLPNIEPVSLMVMLFAVVFGKKALYPIYLYVAMEILFYGLGLWNINYLYIWLVLGVSAYLLRGMRQPLGWAMLSGLCSWATTLSPAANSLSRTPSWSRMWICKRRLRRLGPYLASQAPGRMEELRLTERLCRSGVRLTVWC